MPTDLTSTTRTRTRRGPRPHRPRTPDDRLATWLRRLRWPAVVLWLLAIVALNGLSGSLSSATNDSAAAYLPSSAASTKVAELQEAASKNTETDQAIVVYATSGATALTPSDRAVVDSARAAVAGRRGHVAGLGAPGPVQMSADGKAALFSVPIASAGSSGSADGDGVKAIRAAISAASAARPGGAGLMAAVTGSAAITADGSGGSQQTALLLTALIIVAVILLLVYRSPVLWLLPVFGSIGAIVVAQAATHGLANAGLTVSTLSAEILIVLVFGAASDYALLLVHRYRAELRARDYPEQAMAIALRRTAPTLLASAATVICAMLCLLAADSAALHGLGPVGAVGIAAALLAQVTFLPALLLVIGRFAFWPRIPRNGAAGREESRVWAGIGARVARHPARTAVAVTALLAVACLGLLSLRTANNPVDNVKGDPGSVAGARLLDAHFPAGALAPLTVLTPEQAGDGAVRTIRSVSGVGVVTSGGPVAGYASYSVVLSVPPYGAAGTAAITDLRQRLSGGGPGSLVGGEPAIEYDAAAAAAHDNRIIIPLVLLVILLIVGILLRAVVAPLVLVATTALSFAASFGLSALVWRSGFGFAGVQSIIPIYIFIFLVALGVDYNIFLSARIREESRSAGLRAGTLRGLGVTGGVITAAGVVLAGTFLALTQIPQVNITEVGVAVALGVLLDTLVVRTVLVPAGFLTLGEQVWWPRRLK